VDLKQTEKGVVVIEVNDNPSIDAGVEDEVLKDDLYRTLIEDFVARLDLRRQVPRPETVTPPASKAGLRLPSPASLSGRVGHGPHGRRLLQARGPGRGSPGRGPG